MTDGHRCRLLDPRFMDSWDVVAITSHPYAESALAKTAPKSGNVPHLLPFPTPTAQFHCVPNLN